MTGADAPVLQAEVVQQRIPHELGARGRNVRVVLREPRIVGVHAGQARHGLVGEIFCLPRHAQEVQVLGGDLLRGVARGTVALAMTASHASVRSCSCI